MATKARQLSSVLGTFRNKIINGDFDIWQRWPSQTSSGYGSDDRWRNNHVGSSKTASQQTFTPGQTDVPGNPKYYSRTIVNSVEGAGNYCFKQQRIEGVDTFAGKTITVSFYARADAVKNIALEFVQEFGTGGSPSAVLIDVAGEKISLTTSWVKHEITMSIPSISGKTLGTNGDDYLGLYFWFEAGSDMDSRTDSLGQQSGTFDIAQVQIEDGPVATEFEKRAIGTEMALCQRYYENYAPASLGHCEGTLAYFDIYTAVSMRVEPSITRKQMRFTRVGFFNAVPTTNPTVSVDGNDYTNRNYLCSITAPGASTGYVLVSSYDGREYGLHLDAEL